MKIGFIGLGIMGESMCENIVKKHDDTVYCFYFIPAKVELLASKGCHNWMNYMFWPSDWLKDQRKTWMNHLQHSTSRCVKTCSWS